MGIGDFAIEVVAAGIDVTFVIVFGVVVSVCIFHGGSPWCLRVVGCCLSYQTS